MTRSGGEISKTFAAPSGEGFADELTDDAVPPLRAIYGVCWVRGGEGGEGGEGEQSERKLGQVLGSCIQKIVKPPNGMTDS